MINLNDFEKSTIKTSSGSEDPGYYNVKTKTFIPQELFYDEILKNYKNIKKELKIRDKEIEKLKKTIHFERQKNNEKYSDVRKKEYLRGQTDICQAILDRYDLYKGERFMSELSSGYAHVIEDLKASHRWIIL